MPNLISIVQIQRVIPVPIKPGGEEFMPGFESAQVKQENSRKTENSDNQVQREEKYGNEGGMLSSSISSRIQSKRGSGTPLPPSMLKDYEQKFRRNMDDVRIHQDAESNELNEQMSARAFTIGSDIFLSDSVHPSAGGRDLETLTHEMTHVVQQDGKASSGQLRLGAVDTDQEKEADSVASGESIVNFSSLDTVQRNHSDDEDEKKEKEGKQKKEGHKKRSKKNKGKLNSNPSNSKNIIEEDKKEGEISSENEFEIQKLKKGKGKKINQFGPKSNKSFSEDSNLLDIGFLSGKKNLKDKNLINPVEKENLFENLNEKDIENHVESFFIADEFDKNSVKSQIIGKNNNQEDDNKSVVSQKVGNGSKNRLDKYTEKKEKEKERKEIEDNYEIIGDKEAKGIKDESNIEEMSKLPLAKELTKNQVDKKTSEKGYGIMGRIGSAFGYWALSSLLGLVSKDLASAVVGAMKESGSINEKIENAISKMPLADQNNITIINSDIDSKKKEKETEGKKLQHYRKEAKKLEKSQNMLYAKQLEAMGGQYKTQKGLEEGDFGSLNSYYKSHEKDENTYNKGMESMESTYEIVDKNDFQVVKQNDKAKQQNNVPVPNKNGNKNKPQRNIIKIEENENLEDQKDKNKNLPFFVKKV